MLFKYLKDFKSGPLKVFCLIFQKKVNWTLWKKLISVSLAIFVNIFFCTILLNIEKQFIIENDNLLLILSSVKNVINMKHDAFCKSMVEKFRLKGWSDRSRIPELLPRTNLRTKNQREIKRLTRYDSRNSKRIETDRSKITFNSTTIPKKVTISFFKFPVRQFYPLLFGVLKLQSCAKKLWG